MVYKYKNLYNFIYVGISVYIHIITYRSHDKEHGRKVAIYYQ
jgi:hypothetical protein